MLNKKGIVVIATGHPYYGRMAFNLAKTIKSVDRSCPIQLICDATALDHVSGRETWVFDDVTHVPASNAFRLKLHVDQLSQFEEFILMDADTAWVATQSPIDVIDQLSSVCEFSGITEGFYDYDDPQKSDVCKTYYFWADTQELNSEYELGGKIYQWRTEFMYVKKCHITKLLFETARYVYDQAHQLTTLKHFAGHVPDELGINVAACAHGIKPHIYKWRPTFWHRIHGETISSIEHLQSAYYALSCGSNVTSGNVKKLYDRLVRAASCKLGMSHVFPMTNKREMIPQRQQM
jgi:hypothetical protein